jgi:hypothetical protein
MINFDQSKFGDKLMRRNVLALMGAVAVLITATVALSLSRVTVASYSNGNLKCYGTGGNQKPC